VLGLTPLELFLSFIITWTIGLAPPLLIRYIFAKKPLEKWPAIGTCAGFWFLNILLFAAMGSQSKSHTVLLLIAFVSYTILRRPPSEKKLRRGPPATGGS
jgi:hypothetical protein